MKKACILTAYSVLIAILIAICFITPFSTLWAVIFTVLLTGTLVGLFLGKLKYTKIYRTFIAVFILEAIIIAVYLILYYSGLLVHFSSIEAAQEWFNSFGAWAWAIFFLIQIAQVIILPIPSQITTVSGVLIFGGLKAFIISAIAIISGSLIAFGIGRSLGVKVAYKIASKETVDKYRNLLSKKSTLLLPIMFIFPLFPDDLLCFIAGTTKMSWLYFITITLLTRTIGIGCICFFGSGNIIPFSGWGIPVWIILFALLITTAIFLMKYQDQITNWIINKFGKKKTTAKNKDLKNNTKESKETELIQDQKSNKSSKEQEPTNFPAENCETNKK